MAQNLDDVSLLLGEIRGTLKALTQELRESKQESHDSRTRMFERFDEQDESMQAMATAAAETRGVVRHMRDVIEKDIKPVTDDVRKWRLMGVGALMVTGLGAAWFGANMAWIWQAIVAAVRVP